jgi:hypothetical protein
MNMGYIRKMEAHIAELDTLAAEDKETRNKFRRGRYFSRDVEDIEIGELEEKKSQRREE